MNEITKVAQNYQEIATGPPVICACGEEWYSLFDKLYVSAYGKCTSCSTVEEVERLSKNIFAIIQAIC